MRSIDITRCRKCPFSIIDTVSAKVSGKVDCVKGECLCYDRSIKLMTDSKPIWCRVKKAVVEE